MNRSYSSGQGRFTSVDPIGMGASSLTVPQSLNLYAYVGNNPIDFVDPLGLTYFSLPEEQECRYEPVYTYYETDVKIQDDDSGNPVSIGGTGGGSSSGWDVRWVLVCESKRTIAPITTPEPVGGGGTSTPPPTTTGPTDPCAGKKGALDFSSAMQHIFDRHITTAINTLASKFVFWPWQLTRSQYESEVQSIAQTVFENGRFVTSGNSIVYSFGLFYAEVSGIYLHRHVGIQGKTGAKLPSHIGAATNIATVVVKNDCKTVITAYPGLPRQFNSVPNGIFKHGGISTQHQSQF